MSPTKDVFKSATVTRYQKRISGPLLDQIDIHVDVPRVPYEKPTAQWLGESSEIVRARVETARERERARFKGTDLDCNADMRTVELRKYCKLDDAGTALLKAAMAQLGLSARAFHRALKLARTIAELAGSLYLGRNYHRGFHLVAPGKSQTYSVEAGNAERRHYIKCLARRTRCFAKRLVCLLRRVKFFVHCWNQRQWFRRAHPFFDRPRFSCASFDL